MAGKKNRFPLEKGMKNVAEQGVTQNKSSDSQLIAAVAWIISFLGIIFYFMKKDDSFVKFHAIQSAIFGVAMMVIIIGISIISGIATFVFAPIGAVLGCLSFIAALLWLVVDLAGAYKAYNGERYKFPVIGDMAEKHC